MRRVSYPSDSFHVTHGGKPQAKNSGCPEPKLRVILIPNRCERLKCQCASFSAGYSDTIGPSAQLLVGGRMWNRRCSMSFNICRVSKINQRMMRFFAKNGPIKVSLAECRNCQPVWNCVRIAFEAFHQMLWLFSLAAVQWERSLAQSKQSSFARGKLAVIFLPQNDRSDTDFRY